MTIKDREQALDAIAFTAKLDAIKAEYPSERKRNLRTVYVGLSLTVAGFVGGQLTQAPWVAALLIAGPLLVVLGASMLGRAVIALHVVSEAKDERWESAFMDVMGDVARFREGVEREGGATPEATKELERTIQERLAVGL
jgi:hypothetical protein